MRGEFLLLIFQLIPLSDHQHKKQMAPKRQLALLFFIKNTCHFSKVEHFSVLKLLKWVVLSLSRALNDTANRIFCINMILEFFNLSLPDGLKCVGARLRQIGAFWPLTGDCTRLRDRRMSLIMSKGRAAVFLSYIEAGTSVKSHLSMTSQFYDLFYDLSVSRDPLSKSKNVIWRCSSSNVW